MKDTDILVNANTTVEEVLDDMDSKRKGNVETCTLKDVEMIVDQLLKSLPKVNRTELRQEMMDMSVPIQKTPTTFDINEGLAKSQGYRDRLAEIYILAQKDYKIRKRCLEMLYDAINLISKEKSADKRRGEATMKYPMILLQTEAAEIFLKEVEQILSNMKVTMDGISRQASVLNMQIQLGEVRKKEPNQFNQPNYNATAEEISPGKSSNKTSFGWENI